MARKLKRLFSMLLVISMVMSQVSVAAFAEELKTITESSVEILSSDTQGGYLVSTDSDCESVPQTSSNASIENETVVIPGQEAMLSGMLPETVEVTDLRLLEKIDGTPDFNGDDDRGHDSAPDNGILRTLDTVTYNLRMAIQEPEDPTREGETEEIQIMAVIPGVESGDVQFLTDSMHWLYDAEVEETEEGLVMTGYTMVDTTADSVYWQDIAISMKAFNMDQGESFAPEFYAWIDGQETPASVTKGTKVTISAKEMLNISLEFDTESQRSTYDLSLEEGVSNEVFGDIFGLTFRVELMSDSNELKGIRIPSEKIEFDLDLGVFNSKTNPAEDITSEHVPQVWDYTQLRSNQEVKGKIGRELVSKIAGKRLLPYGQYNAEYPERSVYESGKLAIEQNGNTLHVTITDYDFGDEIVFPEKTQFGNVFTSSSNKGAFSTGMIQILVPYEHVTETLLYTLVSEVQNLKLSGKDMEQMDLSDDKATRQIQSVSGSWNQRMMFAHKEDFSDDPTTLTVGSTAISGIDQGNYYAYPGEEAYLIGRFSASWPDRYFNGVDYLIKVPSAMELPEIEEMHHYVTSGSYYNGNGTYIKYDDLFDEYKIRYAAKADGTGWASEYEMDTTMIPEMVYYDSKEDAKAAGAEILGVLFEIRSGKETHQGFCTHYVVPIKISEEATENYVYPVCFEISAYGLIGDAYENGLTTEHGVTHIQNENLDAANSKIKYFYDWSVRDYGPDGENSLHYRKYINLENGGDRYNSFSFIYKKSEYENGQVKAGTHVTKTSYSGTMLGQFGGNSILIVGTQAGIEKEVEQLGTDGKARSVFNLNQGQREVDYVLKPTYKFPVEYLLKEETDTLTIKDVLDDGLTYVVGSAYQGGTYDQETESVVDGIAFEPVVTEDSEGRQVLTWTLENVKAGEEIAPIHYSATIDAGIGNGALLKNTVSVTAPSDERPVTEASGKVSTASIQVVQSRGSYLNKSVDKPYAELADEITYTVTFQNNGNDTYEDVLVKDILPYEGDGRGTDFKGATYKVSSIKVSTNSNAEIFVTTMNPDAIASTEDMYTKADSWNGWVKLEEGMSLEGITAIACKEDVPAGEALTIDISLEINCPVTRALFVNNVEAYTSDHQKLKSLNVKSTVLPRKVSGVAWFDADEDGSRDNGESLLAGIKVTLLDKEGNAVKDIYGNAVNAVVTGNDGAYSFDNLAAGEYQVKFESDTYKLDSLVVTAMDAADDVVDSDAVAVYDGETLKAAVIAGIDLPELEDIAKENLDEWHEAHLDAGFHNPKKPEDPTEPSEPETNPSEPETNPSEPETNPSEPETTPSTPTSTPKDDDDDDKPVKPTTPTVPETTPQETVTDVITEIVPETTPLPEVSPDADPEDIPQEVLDAYYERYIKGDIDLDDIPVGVLGAFYEKGLLAAAPHTGDPSNIWTIMMLISMLGLAVTSVIDRKRVRK